jgi:hypothetical protein
MGRPVNKRNFGKGTGNQLKTKFKLGGTQYDGYIVSQRSTRRFKVSSMNDAVTGICTLVDKETGSLDNGEMIVVVRLDDGTTGTATKIYNRVAIVNGNKVPWNYSSSTTDNAAQVADADATGLSPVITIGTQPQNASVVEPATATFTVVATATPTATLVYQWQIQQSGTGAWANIAGATSASYTTGATAVAAGSGATNGDKFRVIVDAVGAAAVTSNAATLTVTSE